MLDELMQKYYEIFGEIIELPLFMSLDEEEQIKILKKCIEEKQKIYENKYFNDNYMERTY